MKKKRLTMTTLSAVRIYILFSSVQTSLEDMEQGTKIRVYEDVLVGVRKEVGY